MARLILMGIAAGIAQYRTAASILQLLPRLHALARGDLRPQAPARSRIREVQQLFESVDQVQRELSGMLDAVGQAVAQVSAVGDRLQPHFQDIQTHTRAQRTQAQAASNAVQSLHGSVRDVAQHAADVSDAASGADLAVRQGSATVARSIQGLRTLITDTGRASTLVDQLDQEMTQISRILQVIVTIAEQTNLLALNAAIEAARAGRVQDFQTQTV